MARKREGLPTSRAQFFFTSAKFSAAKASGKARDRTSR